jgi:hypothetical protein
VFAHACWRDGRLALCQTLLAMSANADELVRDLWSMGGPERVAESARVLVTQADELLDQGSADEALKVLDAVIDAARHALEMYHKDRVRSSF